MMIRDPMQYTNVSLILELGLPISQPAFFPIIDDGRILNPLGDHLRLDIKRRI